MDKRRDDFQPPRSEPWTQRLIPLRISRWRVLRRLVAVIGALAIVYLLSAALLGHFPLDRRDDSTPYYYFPGNGREPSDFRAAAWADIELPDVPPHGIRKKPKSKPMTGNRDKARDRTYNGPIIFPDLAPSLRAVTSDTQGQLSSNKNVLFAAGSLKSAAVLLPMACKMGRELRNYVHFALMSRSEIELDDLKKVNGIDDSCHIIFHDARPDYSADSPDSRMVLAASKAFSHIHTFIHPQAVITDGTDADGAFLSRGLRDLSPFDFSSAVIELPKDGPKRLHWLHKLDSASLAAWNRVNIDIVVHASSKGSTNLIRLLRSLSRADLVPFPIPRLTIELPQRIEPATELFLKNYRWPPLFAANPSNVQMLSLRHRIPRGKLTEEESAIRFLESFWPADSSYSHILVLSPQTEVTPQFFHYLKYALLEYKYSNAARMQGWDRRLVGISADSPSSYVNGSGPFANPQPLTPESGYHGATPFLWQAPDSNIVLFLGEKWIELHGFVSQILEAKQVHPTLPPTLGTKLVSRQYPSWMEYILQLSRARGYFTAYPSPDTASAAATVHGELPKWPEEYDDGTRVERVQTEPNEARMGAGEMLDVLHTLPHSGKLIPFNDMPILNWEGRELPLKELDSEAQKYTLNFRREVGGCSGLALQNPVVDASAKDLFCLPGI